MVDLTEQALKQFANPSAWDGVFPVPIFVPHEVTHKDGKKVRVDEKRLQKICDKINQLYQDRGVPIPFTAGHRVPTFPYPEEDQPDILAWGKDARVGEFHGHPAIILDQYVLKDCLPRVKTFPFRSAEFYDESDEITGVALLRRDPKLDMGILFYQQSSQLYSNYDAQRGSFCLYMENAMPDPTVNPSPLDLEKEDAGDPEFEKFCNYMKRYMDENPGSFGAPKMDDEDTLPGAKKDDLPPLDYQRDQLPPALAKRLATLEQKTKEAEDRALHVEARETISRVRNAGYYMADPEGEVKALIRTPRDEWNSYVKKIQLNYQRDPAAGEMIKSPDGVSRDGFDEAPQPRDPAEANAVVLYAERHGLDAMTPEGLQRATVEYRKHQKQRA